MKPVQIHTKTAELSGLRHTTSGLVVHDVPVVYCFAYRWVKRGIDVVGALLGLLILSPLFLVVGALIKLTSPGPVFYPWDVIGRGGRPFRGYKFRTMVQNADELKAQLMHRNEMTGPVFKIEDDPRVTPLGRFLRKYSIDELPQRCGPDLRGLSA